MDDVLRSAFGRLHALTAEMEALAGRMAAGENGPGHFEALRQSFRAV